MAWPEERRCAKQSTNQKARRRSCLKSKISSNLASKCVARAPSPARRNQRFERGRTKVHEKYLGDSYDLVKRFWCESLGPVAPLYAHPRFCSLSNSQSVHCRDEDPNTGCSPGGCLWSPARSAHGSSGC